MLPAVSAKGIGKKTTGMGHASLNADKVVTIALIANVTHQSRSISRYGRREDAYTHSTTAEMLLTTLVLPFLTTTLGPRRSLRWDVGEFEPWRRRCGLDECVALGLRRVVVELECA